LTATANDKCFGRSVTNTAKTGRAASREPAIIVSKTCPPAPVQPGQPLVFTGTVSNAGNITLTNVLVVNDRLVPNTSVFCPVTLAPGQATNFTGSYIIPLDSCGPYPDTLTATANDKCFGRSVTNPARASFPTRRSSDLTVSKTCPPAPVQPGQPFVFTGTVSNAGNITLT